MVELRSYRSDAANVGISTVVAVYAFVAVLGSSTKRSEGQVHNTLYVSFVGHTILCMGTEDFSIPP